MQSHSTTGLRLSVSQFDLASRYKKNLLHVCFLKEYWGGGLNYFNQCIICLVPLSLNDMTKGSNNEQITRGNTIPSGIVCLDKRFFVYLKNYKWKHIIIVKVASKCVKINSS